MTRNFNTLLRSRWEQDALLCVGLDPDLEKIPDTVKKSDVASTFVAFNKAMIDATKDISCVYKPNSAFYEAHGLDGWRALEETIAYINAVAPEVPVLLDAKRGDIGNTNRGYAKMAFDLLKADAVTVHPYQGGDALEPFFEREEKGVFVLVRTSNPGAGEFQDLKVNDELVYEVVSRACKQWNTRGNVGVVVGTTYPAELARVRSIVGDMPILSPGTGAQGGDLTASVKAGKATSNVGIIVNASRAVLYASSGPDFASAARTQALQLNGAIKAALVE